MTYGTGKQAAKYSFKVKANILVISKKKAKMKVGKTLDPKLKNTDKKPVWSSSDPSKATVIDGKVTALSPGQVTITATVDGADYQSVITIN